MTVFKFRAFEIRQERAAMKLGTDSVLLGCFCEPTGAASVLDIGTGTGILALMLAQKCDARIDAVEIDAAAFEEAKSNIEASEWKHRIGIHHSRIQDFGRSEKYDLVISNPPYFRFKQNMKIEDLQRSKARHDQDLSFESLCEEVDLRLSDQGRFWLILPSAEAKEFKKIAGRYSLHQQQQINIFPKPSKQANRIIMCYGLEPQPVVERDFVIYRDNSEPTPEYIELTKAFYLWKQFDDDAKLKW